MREILFRGKGYSGEWFCGNLRISNLLNDPTDYVEILPINVGPPDFPTYERVQPETVGQYTGLLDKNGKKIFEGDIVNGAFSNGPAEIRMILGAWVACRGKGWSDIGIKANTLEVAGNIHDNPELMEGIL